MQSSLQSKDRISIRTSQIHSVKLHSFYFIVCIICLFLFLHRNSRRNILRNIHLHQVSSAMKEQTLSNNLLCGDTDEAGGDRQQWSMSDVCCKGFSPLGQLEEILHGFDLLEVAGHVSGQNHLDHERPELSKNTSTQTTALNLLSRENNCSASKCEDNSFFLNEKLIVSVCLAVKLHQTFLSLLCLVENSTLRMVKHFFQYFLQGVSRTVPLKNITPLHSYFFIFVIFLNWKDSLLHLKHPIKHPIKYFKTF